MYLENEAYNEKLLSLNNELTALTSELSAKEKLGQRLRYVTYHMSYLRSFAETLFQFDLS